MSKDHALILSALRAIRNGAHFRTMNGDSISDDAYDDCVYYAAKDLHAAIDGRIPFLTLRTMLWRAARVGANRPSTRD